MLRKLSLSEYVKRRNGLALGASGSMSNMFKRSLGASSFYLFWQYWNPIWGYYLSYGVMRPLSRLMPVWLAIIVTFAVSGALHDLAVSLVKWQFIFFFTPWFILMGSIVIITKKLSISYTKYSWLTRALINISLIVISLVLTQLTENYLT